MLSTSLARYLETIYEMSLENDEIKAIRIAERFNVSRTAVNKALEELQKLKLIVKDYYVPPTLTPEGVKLAKRMYRVRSLYKQLLINLGIPHDIAEIDAYKIDYDLSEITISVLNSYLVKKATPIKQGAFRGIKI